MSEKAVIQTKLTADGSELSRALDQGIRKAADFRTQMIGVGKSIGAAFTVSALFNAFRSFANAQQQALDGFQAVGKEADEMQKRLENLAEKTGNASTVKESQKAVQDYAQEIRRTRQELEHLIAQESLGGPRGYIKSLEDGIEKMASGRATTNDEERIKSLTAALEKLTEAYKTATEKAANLKQSMRLDILAEAQGMRRASMPMASKDVESMRIQLAGERENAAFIMRNIEQNPRQEYLDLYKTSLENIKNLEEEIGKAEQDSADKAKKSRQESLQLARQRRDQELAWLEEEQAKRAAMEAAEIQNLANQAAARNLLIGMIPGNDGRASSLRRMGANELGRGTSGRVSNPEQIADKVIGRVQAKFDELISVARNIVTGAF